MYCEAWNRKRIIEFCNTEIFPQVDFEQWSHYNGELMEVVKMVSDFRLKNEEIRKNPHTMIAKVNNGFLYINNLPVGRIAMMKQKVMYNEKANYYESLILSKNEVD